MASDQTPYSPRRRPYAGAHQATNSPRFLERSRQDGKADDGVSKRSAEPAAFSIEPDIWDGQSSESVSFEASLSKQWFLERNFQEFLAASIVIVSCAVIFLCAWFARPNEVKNVDGMVRWAMKGFSDANVRMVSLPDGAPGSGVSAPQQTLKHFGCELVPDEQFEKCLERRLGREILWRSIQRMDPNNVVMFQLYMERPQFHSKKTGPKTL